MFGRGCCNRQQGMFGGPMGGFGMSPCMEQQVIEPTITKCVEKEFCHEVPHICPIHTHVVNRHIYKHTYTPQFTCSEENQVCNIDSGKCSGFLG